MKKKNKPHEDLEIKPDLPGSIADGDQDLEVENMTDPDDLHSEPIGFPPISPAELVELKTALEEIELKADEYLDGWQRSRAEFANYKKRILKEHNDIHQAARGDIIKLYLDIADDLKRALEDKPTSGEGESWAEGIEIISQKLNTRLEAEGIRPMKALGHEFDPNIHEALMKEESEEYESGQIIEVMQEGYWIGEKVLRPALVRVAA